MSINSRIYKLLFVVFLPLATASAKEATDLYREAQMQETTARDMQAASVLYQDFLKQPHTDRSLQANAYLHWGLCEAKMGHNESAKAAWKKVVQDYSDQSDAYSQALNQLQQLQLADVRNSTPVVKEVRVYEEPPARWMVEFPRGTFLHTVDSKGRLIETAAGGSLGFVRYVQPHTGVGMEVGNLGASGPPSARRNISYFIVMVRKEKPLTSALTGYFKGGGGTYFFHFSNDQTSELKVNLGGTLESGLTIGLPRGFAFNFGYLLHLFLQSTPSQSFQTTIPPADINQADSIVQNHGLRCVGGPDVSLSFRW